jgi:hypothetical protein
MPALRRKMIPRSDIEKVKNRRKKWRIRLKLMLETNFRVILI